MPYPFRHVWHPELYQGGRISGRRRRYFEGWYNKLVSADGKVCALIPGVSFKDTGEAEAFIQFIDGTTNETGYYSYPIDEFSYSKRRLDLRVGKSTFGEDGISLDLEDRDSAISGEIHYHRLTRLKSKPLSPGIMGWYTFVPFMECYHGVVSLDHQVDGDLVVNGERVDFNRGRGYIEKDWGRSFPSSWIWIQTNHFGKPGSSCMLSIARIPWLGSSFPGFLCTVLHDDTQYRFATYSGARITRLVVGDGTVSVDVEDGKLHLEIEAQAGSPCGLKAPVEGAMSRIITESVTSNVTVRLSEKTGRTILEGTGKYGGMEIAGDMSELTPH